MRNHTENLEAVAFLKRLNEKVYEELPGWQEDLSEATELHDLPRRALDYLDFLEELVGVPIRLVGVGPGRTQFVQRTP